MTPLIDAHVAYLRAGGYSARTIGARTEVLGRLHDALPYGLAFAATEQIQAWLGTEGWSRWTRYTYSGHVRAFFAWADGTYLDGDPAADIPVPTSPRCVPRPVSDEELAQALGSKDPWHTAVVLAAFAGMRVTEIARCDREHVTESTVHIPDGKGGEPGVVPTHPFLWTTVRDRPAGPLVVGPRGRVNGRWISATARGHFDALGLVHVHMHRFRHWYGTNVLRQTGDLRVTQECLRHRSVTSTQGYTLVTAEQRTAAVAGLPVPGAPTGR